MKYITAFELNEKIENKESLQIIDTREVEKYREGHLPGAINIPQSVLPENNSIISNDVPVIIYCLYGVKSQAPYLYLTEKRKFKNIYILEGGIYQWTMDIDPSINAY